MNQPATTNMRQDAKGRWVPVDTIAAIDLLRDETVRQIVEQAKSLQIQMAAFKANTLKAVQDFVELSAQDYDKAFGGKKGNVSLCSFDGHYKVQRALQDHIDFDERLQVAKSLIDQCIQKWSAGARPEIVALVNDAFQVDKQGNVSTVRILGLRRLDIQDPTWLKAMDAISDSIMVSVTKTYLRLYERDGQEGQYKPLSLDLASLP